MKVTKISSNLLKRRMAKFLKGLGVNKIYPNNFIKLEIQKGNYQTYSKNNGLATVSPKIWLRANKVYRYGRK